jgi:putative hemolysin
MLVTLGLELLIILVLVIINGILSMSELSIISARKARLRAMADGGDKKAAIALQLSESPERMMSTVQIGITMMGILSGAFGGATLSALISDSLIHTGLTEEAADVIGFAIVVLAITYLSLVLGELVPKRIALFDPESAARRLAGPIKFLSRITSPVVTLLSASTLFVVRLLGIKENTASKVTDEEVEQLLSEGAAAGIFEEEERKMVGHIFRMSDQSVKDLMTPRRDIDWLDVSETREAILDKVRRSPHTFFPLGEGKIDLNVGVVRAKHILQQLLEGKDLDLKAIADAPALIPETASAFDAMEALRRSQTPIALVVDEYGGIDGIITQSDVLSAIIGGTAEVLGHEPIVRRDDGSYLVDASLAFEKLAELLDVSSGDEELPYRTIAGFVLNECGFLPKPGDSFLWHGSKIEVVDLDGNRIDKILVVPRTLNAQ